MSLPAWPWWDGWRCGSVRGCGGPRVLERDCARCCMLPISPPPHPPVNFHWVGKEGDRPVASDACHVVSGGITTLGRLLGGKRDITVGPHSFPPWPGGGSATGCKSPFGDGHRVIRVGVPLSVKS